MDAVTINNGAAATVYSKKISMNNGSILCLHYEYTGTPTSTITFWESNYPDPLLTDDTQWVEDTAVTAQFSNPAGSASKGILNLGNVGSRWCRIKVVTASGSGTFSLKVNHNKGL